MAVPVASRPHPPSEVDTGVTKIEVEQLLADAEDFDWSQADRFSMLAWMELAVSVFQRMVGEPETPLF